VKRQDPGNVDLGWRVERPSRGRAREFAGTDRVEEHLVQLGARRNMRLDTAVVDALSEVLIELFTERLHASQDAPGHVGVLTHCGAQMGQVASVEDSCAVCPRQQIAGSGQVLAPLVGVLAPGHGVDEIKRDVTTDERDRLRPGRELRNHSGILA